MAVALAVSIVNNRRLRQENLSLAAENRRLRDEVGELSIEDASQFHAMRVSGDDDLEWAWRIWIPEGCVYRLRLVGSEIPKEGFPPQTGGTIWLRESGEHLIRYRIRRDPRDGKWYGRLSAPTGSVGKDEQPWVEWPSHTSMTGGVGGGTKVFSPDERVELARHRVSQAKSSEDIEDPAAGFLIWLERGN